MVRFGELHLVSRIVVVAIYSRVWTIRRWPVVRGASRHSCSKDRSMYSSKGVVSRCVEHKVWELRIEDWGANLGHILNCFITYLVFIFLVFELTLSVCVWRWSCNSLHGSRCGCRWARGCLDSEWGQLWEFLLVFFMNYFVMNIMNN